VPLLVDALADIDQLVKVGWENVWLEAKGKGGGREVACLTAQFTS